MVIRLLRNRDNLCDNWFIGHHHRHPPSYYIDVREEILYLLQGDGSGCEALRETLAKVLLPHHGDALLNVFHLGLIDRA